MATKTQRDRKKSQRKHHNQMTRMAGVLLPSEEQIHIEEVRQARLHKRRVHKRLVLVIGKLRKMTGGIQELDDAAQEAEHSLTAFKEVSHDIIPNNDDYKRSLEAMTLVDLRKLSRGKFSGGYTMKKTELVETLAMHEWENRI